MQSFALCNRQKRVNMKYFVSADIHGFFDEWMSALKKNDFDIDNQQHKIVVCGDLFDRGRQPKQIIDFVVAGARKRR